MATLTLTAAADTDIEETNPATNYGDEGSLLVGEPSGSATRSLIKFTTSSLPSDATLVSAVLRIYATNEVPSIADISAYGILRDWVEAEATWNKYDSSHTWTAAGCDVGSDIYATSSGDVSANVVTGWVEITLTATVANLKSWYGFHLRLTGAYADEQLAFSSSEGSNPPQLVITYTVSRDLEPLGISGYLMSTTETLRFPMFASDGVTLDASATVTVRILGTDGSWYDPTSGPTNETEGVYSVVVTQATHYAVDGVLTLKATATGCLATVMHWRCGAIGANVVEIDDSETAATHLKEDIEDGYERGEVAVSEDSSYGCAATTTTFCTTLTQRATNGYKDQAIQFMSGNLAGETRHIEASVSYGAYTEITLYSDRPLPEAPADGDEVWTTGCLQPRETA